MKKIKLISALFIAVAVLGLSSCSSDDDGGGDSVSSSYSYDGGTEIDLTKGILESYGDNGNGSYDFDVTLFSDGITIDTTNDEITGAGHVVYLDLNSDDAAGLSDGTYTWASSRIAMSVVAAAVIPDADFDNQTGVGLTMSGGTATMAVNGSTYTITFDFTDADGKVLTGSYVGSLTDF